MRPFPLVYVVLCPHINRDSIFIFKLIYKFSVDRDFSHVIYSAPNSQVINDIPDDVNQPGLKQDNSSESYQTLLVNKHSTLQHLVYPDKS